MRTALFPGVKASAQSDVIYELWLRAAVGDAWQSWRPSRRRGAGAEPRAPKCSHTLCANAGLWELEGRARPRVSQCPQLRRSPVPDKKEPLNLAGSGVARGQGHGVANID